MTESLNELAHIDAMIARSRQIVSESMNLTRKSQERFRDSPSINPDNYHKGRADSFIPSSLLDERGQAKDLVARLEASESERRRLERVVEDMRRKSLAYEEFESLHKRSREDYHRVCEQAHLLQADNQELQARENQFQGRLDELQRDNAKLQRELSVSEHALRDMQSLKEKVTQQLEDYKMQCEDHKRLREQLKTEKVQLQATYEQREYKICEQLRQEVNQAKADIAELQTEYRNTFVRLQEELQKARRAS